MCILEFVKCSKFCKLKDIFHFWEKNYLIAFTSHLLAQSDFLKKAKGIAFEDDLIFFFFFSIYVPVLHQALCEVLSRP